MYLYQKSKKVISDDEFNSLSEVELKKFIIGYNDGQGDHSFYTFESIITLLTDSDRSNKKPLSEMTKIEILDEFYDDVGLTGNSSDIVYFNGVEFQLVEFTG